MRTYLSLIAAASFVFASFAADAMAQSRLVNGGSTTVSLDTTTLASAASLTLSGAPGANGTVSTPPGGVAFEINSRGAASLPTTFAFTPADFPSLGSFSGAIEHTGLVQFNNDTVTVGDFTIGFDAARATGANSGFFVESTAGIQAILFDTQVTSLAASTDTLLDLSVDLVVSPEFAGFLQTNSLASSDLTGADVGDARIVASAVPEPMTAGLVLVGLAAAAARRRR